MSQRYAYAVSASGLDIRLTHPTDHSLPSCTYTLACRARKARAVSAVPLSVPSVSSPGRIARPAAVLLRAHEAIFGVARENPADGTRMQRRAARPLPVLPCPN